MVGLSTQTDLERRLFWKKKPAPGPWDLAKEAKPEAPQSADEKRSNAAKDLAASLRQYHEAALEAARGGPDAEWEAAREKVEKARELVQESRLAYALGRCIPEHVLYWSSWSQREDFQKYVGFAGSDISARREQDGDEEFPDRKTEIVEFTFNGSRYRFQLIDKGYSLVPDDEANKWGYVELYWEDELVARFQVGQDYSRVYSHWSYADVKALKVGEWMQDILEISAQIEAANQKSRERLLAGFDLESAKDIEI